MTLGPRVPNGVSEIDNGNTKESRTDGEIPGEIHGEMTRTGSEAVARAGRVLGRRYLGLDPLPRKENLTQKRKDEAPNPGSAEPSSTRLL